MNRLPWVSLLIVALLAATSATVQAQAARSDRNDDNGSEVPWSLALDFDQSVTVRTFSKKAQLSYDPHYIWWFTYAPRWKFNDH